MKVLFDKLAIPLHMKKILSSKQICRIKYLKNQTK